MENAEALVWKIIGEEPRTLVGRHADGLALLQADRKAVAALFVPVLRDEGHLLANQSWLGIWYPDTFHCRVSGRMLSECGGCKALATAERGGLL